MCGWGGGIEIKITTKKNDAYSSTVTATMSKTSCVIKNQPFTTGSIGCSSDVTITLGCGDRRQAYMCYHKPRGCTVPQCHGVSLQTHRAGNPSSLQDILYSCAISHCKALGLGHTCCGKLSVVGFGRQFVFFV